MAVFIVSMQNRENWIWQFLAAPDNRKVLGNARMISIWPVRGGLVLHGGRISFTVGSLAVRGHVPLFVQC